jgi:hypothetical protein
MLRRKVDPGLTLRVMGLFNPYCALSANTATELTAEREGEGGSPAGSAVSPGVATVAPLQPIGVLNADIRVFKRSVVEARHLRYGMFAKTEFAIAVTVGCALALQLTPGLDNTLSSLAVGLIGYVRSVLALEQCAPA